MDNIIVEHLKVIAEHRRKQIKRNKKSDYIMAMFNPSTFNLYQWFLDRMKMIEITDYQTNDELKKIINVLDKKQFKIQKQNYYFNAYQACMHCKGVNYVEGFFYFFGRNSGMFISKSR